MKVKILRGCRLKEVGSEKVVSGVVGKIYDVNEADAQDLFTYGQAEIVDAPEEGCDDEEPKKAPAKKGAAK